MSDSASDDDTGISAQAGEAGIPEPEFLGWHEPASSDEGSGDDSPGKWKAGWIYDMETGTYSPYKLKGGPRARPPDYLPDKDDICMPPQWMMGKRPSWDPYYPFPGEAVKWQSTVYDDGTTYEGLAFQGTPSNKGVMIKGNLTGAGLMPGLRGDRYEGDFRFGCAHGLGVFSGADGEIYQGQWFYGKRHGCGKLSNLGPFHDNMLEGMEMAEAWEAAQPEIEANTLVGTWADDEFVSGPDDSGRYCHEMEIRGVLQEMDSVVTRARAFEFKPDGEVTFMMQQDAVGLPAPLMQDPLHYPHGTKFMAPGPMGQCFPIPDDEGIKNQMIITANNRLKIFNEWNFDYHTKPGSDQAKAEFYWDYVRTKNTVMHGFKAKTAASDFVEAFWPSPKQWEEAEAHRYVNYANLIYKRLGVDVDAAARRKGKEADEHDHENEDEDEGGNEDERDHELQAEREDDPGSGDEDEVGELFSFPDEAERMDFDTDERDWYQYPLEDDVDEVRRRRRRRRQRQRRVAAQDKDDKGPDGGDSGPDDEDLYASTNTDHHSGGVCHSSEEEAQGSKPRQGASRRAGSFAGPTVFASMTLSMSRAALRLNNAFERMSVRAQRRRCLTRPT